VGYLRVSSLDQNEVRQLEGLALDKTFTDKASGKDVNRSQLETAAPVQVGVGCIPTRPAYQWEHVIFYCLLKRYCCSVLKSVTQS
jgi:hypothetical protein